MAVDINF